MITDIIHAYITIIIMSITQLCDYSRALVHAYTSQHAPSELQVKLTMRHSDCTRTNDKFSVLSSCNQYQHYIIVVNISYT